MKETTVPTNDTGHYIFENIRAVSYPYIEVEYQISGDLYAKARVDDVLIKDNQTTEQDLYLTTKGWVEGFVIDSATDTGAPSAVVTILDSEDNIITTARCDENGSFRIDGLISGVYKDYAEYNGIRSDTQTFNIYTMWKSNLDLFIPDKGSVHGVVRTADGNPVQNASVILERADSTGENQTGTTDGNGQYSFKEVEPGAYQIHAESDQGNSEPVEITIDAGIDKEEDLTLPKPKTYTVTVPGSDDSDIHGSITADKTEATVAETVTLTITPNAGYDVGSVTVKDADGKTVDVKDNKDGTWTFTMPASDVTVSVEFEELKYTVELPDSKSPDAHGSVSSNKETAAEGETVTLTVKPDAGYDVGSVTVKDAGGKEVEVKDNGDGTWTFTMPDSEVTVEVGFVEHKTPETPGGGSSDSPGGSGSSGGSGWSSGSSSSSSHSVTVTRPEHGKVTASRTHPSSGSTVTLTVTPDDGYTLDDLVVRDAKGKEIEVRKNEDGTYSFKMPSGSGDVTVEAVFVTAEDPEPGEDDTPVLPFTDVSPTDASYPAIADMFSHGLMKGVSDTLFAPDLKISRSMLATVLYRLAGEPEVVDAEAAPYQDVQTGSWYADAVAWCTSAGIVNGYDSTHFGPDDLLTREQLAALLYRFAQLQGWAETANTDLTAYLDGSSVAPYAQSAMAWCIGSGILESAGENRLDPGGTVSRVQTAVILDRFCTEFVWGADESKTRIRRAQKP